MIRMSPRALGATLGLLAAAGTSIYIVVRLHQAATPRPTSVRLLNVAPAAADFTQVTLQTTTLLPGPVRLAGTPAGEPTESWLSGPLDLEPGLPMTVAVQAQDPTRGASCTLEPRPQGRCVVRAAFDGTNALRCDYDCQTHEPKP